jgi:hypothetical protein
MGTARTALQLRSLAKRGGELELQPDIIAAYNKRATGEKYR